MTPVVPTTPRAANHRSRINQETRWISSSSTGKRKGTPSHFCRGSSKFILRWLESVSRTSEMYALYYE